MNLYFSHVYCHFSKHNYIYVVELFKIIFDQRIKEMIKKNRTSYGNFHFHDYI